MLEEVLRNQDQPKAWDWLQQRLELQQKENSTQQFILTFTAIPRFTGRQPLKPGTAPVNGMQQLLPALFVYGWTLDRLARIWWLLWLPAEDKAAYTQRIEQLFNGAEMNELAALYSALPLLAYPDAWTDRTAEGIRSNIGTVQEAIMLNNPYPAAWLPEGAWNQLVMKAIFTEKPLQQVIGLRERANAALAAIITDYAHERQAAGRPVNPLQWQLLENFLDENSFRDITRLWHSAYNTEKEAAALVCNGSQYQPAKALLATAPELLAEISEGKLSWKSLAERISLQ
jgi:hypothetical protein